MVAALELAVSILKREGMELQNTSNMNGFVWNINTATEIWEEITLAGAKAAVKLGTSPRSFCIGQGENETMLRFSIRGPRQKVKIMETALFVQT